VRERKKKHMLKRGEEKRSILIIRLEELELQDPN
jgi:hypothetical protein